MNWRKWLDEFSLAGRGILLATRERRFFAGFVPAFIVFGMLINLLAGGFSKFELMWATGFSGTIKILWDAFLAVFGVNQVFSEWLYMFVIALLQGVLIGLIVLLWKKKQSQQSSTKKKRAKAGADKNSGDKGDKSDESAENGNAANVEKAGIITGLIALGAGCPTCGTTLLSPLLGAVFSTGGLAVTGVISSVVTVVAIVIAILSLKRLGVEAYVIIVNEKYLAKKREKECDAKNH